MISWEGSARGYTKSDLTDFKQLLVDSGYFEYAEGHANAFGAGILDENVDKFIEWSNQRLADFDFTPKYRVDYIYRFDDINALNIRNIAQWAELWGEGVEEPLIVLEGINLKRKHMRLNGTVSRTLNLNLPSPLEDISLVKFRSSEEEFENICPNSDLGCVTINIIGTCDINAWNDKPQILIEDYEIVKKTAYYF